MTLATCSAAFFVLFGVYGLTGWVPTAMLAHGEGFAASFGYGAVILMMNFAGTLACSYLTDHLGKDAARCSPGGCWELYRPASSRWSTYTH
jgi:AAHS family 4-hydroxybenzoate transporter-like MFS transporter